MGYIPPPPPPQGEREYQAWLDLRMVEYMERTEYWRGVRGRIAAAAPWAAAAILATYAVSWVW